MTAFGSRDMWQVIDHVNRRHLGGAVNVARYRTQAEAGSVVLQWLAAHADQLDSATQTETGESPTDADLRMAVEQWLAASSVADDSVEEYSHPGESPSVTCPPVVLPAIAHDLLRAVGLLANGLSPLGGTGNAGSDAVDRSRGVVALFHGAAGTGKTLAAHVLAAALSRDIYRVDLGQVVSKYIGETERNLDTVFARAEETGAVLFLDEADALFGRRSEVKDSHDRYANAEAAYLSTAAD